MDWRHERGEKLREEREGGKAYLNTPDELARHVQLKELFYRFDEDGSGKPPLP